VKVTGRTVTVREPRVPRPHFASAEELERHRAFIAQMASPLWERFSPLAQGLQ
jgi:DNA polymerase-3 subunit epsilon